MAQGLEGQLRVGFIGPASLSKLPKAIRAFREHNPRIRLDFSAQSTSEQLPLLRGDRLDIAFVRLFGHDTSGLNTLTFLREPYVLAMPEGHPFGEREVIDITDLEGQPLIFNQRIAQPALYRSLIGSFHRVGFMPNIVQEVNTEQSTVALVATGLGSALVPASSATDSRSGVIFRPLTGELPQWKITALWKKKNQSAILEKFLAVVREFRESELKMPPAVGEGEEKPFEKRVFPLLPPNPHPLLFPNFLVPPSAGAWGGVLVQGGAFLSCGQSKKDKKPGPGPCGSGPGLWFGGSVGQRGYKPFQLVRHGLESPLPFVADKWGCINWVCNHL